MPFEIEFQLAHTTVDIEMKVKVTGIQLAVGIKADCVSYLLSIAWTSSTAT